ncbi:N utilization substance protein B [Microlunatus panaciterrae]|uniref:Transcription antitermination protein NusB n=1 Tax=Microlunatus panaciterrae TaxID=400768 RepID=A0ABS2RE44_9ACTN|nr:transcription antitermination factor NusB [Microlunatus panaciterrae]MBM7797261.1 N utilization substance protein B [Microlunatus panaciterrae]
MTARSKGSTRSKARKRALDILFEAELRGSALLDTLAERTADADPPVRDYTAELVHGFSEHRHDIDARISAALTDGWSLDRLPRVDRNCLRIAVFEIDYSDLPDSIAVSEALNLVGDLSTDESPGFVNGVLGTIVATKVAVAPHG